MAREERPGFMLYYETLDALDEYSAAETGIFVRAAGNYARTGTLPEFEDRGLRGLWRLVQPKLDRDDFSYSEKCRKNRYNAYVSAAKRAYRKRFPGKSEPVEGVDFLDFESWGAQIDEPTASQRIRPSANGSQLQQEPEPEPEPQQTTSTQQNRSSNNSENENLRGEPGGVRAVPIVFDEWCAAMKAGDKKTASELSAELSRMGYIADPITNELRKRDSS